MFLIVLVGGMLLLAYSSLSTTRLKRGRKTVVLMPLLFGLVLTTLVYAASVDASSGEQTNEQQQVFNTLQITGVSLIVLGIFAVLAKARYAAIWLPNDAPFEAYKPYKPFKPAYTNNFSAAPLPSLELHTMALSEAARYLHISEHDVWMLIDEGSIIAMKRGNSYHITRRALDDFAHSEKFGL